MFMSRGVRQERTDDVMETKLFLRRVTSDSFRRYTLVAENSVAVRTYDVRFVRSKHSANTVIKLAHTRYLRCGP